MRLWTRRPNLNSPSAALPVLIGHSHSECLFKAAAQAGEPLAGYNFWTAPQPAFNEDRTQFHPEIAARLSRGTVFSAIGGGVHTTLGMVRHPRPFDFILPARPDLPTDPDAQLVPYQALRDRLAHDLEEYHRIIALVKAVATGPVFHFEAPPPSEDSAKMYPDIAWSFYEGTTDEISPPLLRYKIWRATMELTADFCARTGVTYIPHPPEVADDRGFLRPEFYKDPTHTNEAYGDLILTQMRAVL